jgi:hypothetical protein
MLLEHPNYQEGLKTADGIRIDIFFCKVGSLKWWGQVQNLPHLLTFFGARHAVPLLCINCPRPTH